MRCALSGIILYVSLAIAATAALRSAPHRPPQGEPEGYIDDDGEPQIVGHEQPDKVSLIRLIAYREQYDGKRVATQGFLVDKFEHHALYLSHDDAKYAVTYNGLWLGEPLSRDNAGDAVKHPLRDGHLKYVTIEGKFRKVGHGHLGTKYGGKLDEVLIRKIHGETSTLSPRYGDPAARGEHKH